MTINSQLYLLYSNILNKTSLALNLKQNQPDFELDSLNNQALIFKYNYLSKTLDPPKANPEILSNYQTVTIKCLFRGY